MRSTGSYRRKFEVDYLVILAMALLVVIGITMSFSVGFSGGKDGVMNTRLLEALGATRRYTLFLIPGFFSFLLAILYPVRWYRKTALLLYGLTLLLLVVVKLMPHEAKGAKRWIELGPVHFQPSELAKLALVWFVAWYVSVRGRWLHLLIRGVLPLIGGTVPIVFLILIQPNISTAGLMVVLVLLLLFLAEVPLRHLGLLVGGAVLAGLLAFGTIKTVPAVGTFLNDQLQKRFPHAAKRLEMFQNPDENPAWKATRVALGEGGFLGTGVGRGKIKFTYLPEADKDYVYGVIGEEMGILGMWGVLILYLLLGWRALSVAQKLKRMHKDPMLYLTAAGIGLILWIFPLAHMGVVLGLLPPTGQPLPFVSMGGTNLVLHMVLLGFLLRLHHVAQTGEEVLA